VAGSIFIGWRILHVRHRTPPAGPGATLVESLRAELRSVRAQSQLLGSILWWYLLPLAIGSVVFVWGLPSTLGFQIAFTAVTAALDGFIYWLNQRARSVQLHPVEAQLASLLNSAETGAPMDETQLAELRPIAISLAAGEEIKPVEFGVAFSQLAIYALIAFVGIWFFLMLSHAIDNRDWKTLQPVLETSAQVIPAVESNRYSAVAQKIVDLLNAGDYAGIQKLYNPAMSNVFPTKETSDFYTRLSNFGKVEKFEGTIGKGYRGWIAFRLICDHGALLMSVALDADDKISGIYFEPAPALPLDSRSIIRQMFGWPQLVSLVAFVVVGLLFTWMLWKVTKRAVGISPAGIHLHRGMNLILWDDIGEIRTFRFLNIRSLRLVRKTGEKMIIPWTSLEHPAELRSAVETFAPPDHPIRKHLDLLKRSR